MGLKTSVKELKEKKAMKRLIALSALFIFSAAGMAFAGSIDMKRAKSANEALDRGFRTAIESLDSAALGRLYAEDALMVEQGQDKPLMGRKAVQDSWQGFFDGLNSIKIEKWSAEYRVMGDSVIGYGYAVLMVEDKEGKTERIRVDYSDLRRADAKGQWQIVQDFAAIMPVPEEG